MSVAAIRDFIALEDGTGLGGQPTVEQFPDLRDEGYDAIVNLLPADAPGALAEEARIVADLGLAYHAIPVLWNAPGLADYEAFTDAMDGLGDARIFVHCAANFRVTAFYALYAQQRLGWSVAEADALMDRIWNAQPNVPMNDGWKRLIADVRAGSFMA